MTPNSQNTVANACRLVQLGFYVFPLYKNSKVSKFEKYFEKSISEERLAVEVFSSPEFEESNLAIDTSRFADGEWKLLGLDIDCKNENNDGFKFVKKQKENGNILPSTFIQNTPSGGMHLIYKTKTSIRNSVGKVFPGIDIRGEHGYLVAVGSTIDSKRYEANWMPVAEAPEWLISMVRDKGMTVTTPPVKGRPVVVIDPIAVKSEALRYLKQAPLAIQGEGGDTLTYWVACEVRDIGLSREQTFEAMMDHWNHRCLPPWSEEELARKVDNAYKYAKGAQGSKAPEKAEDIFEAVDFIAEFNKKYCFVGIGNNSVIIQKQKDANDAKGLIWWAKSVFKDLHMDQFKIENKRKNYLVDLWLKSERLEKYRGFTFNPENTTHSHLYNTWNGFAVKPLEKDEEASKEAQKGMEMFLNHILQNMCCGNEKLNNWFLNYLGHLFQFPHIKPRAAIVMKGTKRVGKTFIMEVIQMLVGEEHFLIADDDRYLTGNFNGHFLHTLCIGLDEGFWSGDKKADSKLKGLISGKNIQVEQKGLETKSIRNFLRIFISSNEERVVNATIDEHRYAVFAFGEGKKGDSDYFKQIIDLLIHSGGANCLMRYFMSLKIDMKLVNEAPQSVNFDEERQSSFEPHEQWWNQVLEDGGFTEEFDDKIVWPENIYRKKLRDKYIIWVEASRIRKFQGNLLNTVHFGRFMNKVMPSVRTYQQFRMERQYLMASLEQAREHWVTINKFDKDYFLQ